MDHWGTSAPAGYVFADGKTIGDASSNATAFADASCLNLFTLLWTDYSNTILPIYTSAAVLSTRGASAAADWAAHKQITLIDKRGRVSAAADNMGGTAASILTSATMSPDGQTLGATGGAQTHTLSAGESGQPGFTVSGTTSGQSAAHTHDVTSNTWYVYSSGAQYAWTGSNAIGGAGTDGLTSSAESADHSHTWSDTIAAAGAGSAHTNVQPTIVCNYIIKL
jgi:microcystin-dependent protein